MRTIKCSICGNDTLQGTQKALGGKPLATDSQEMKDLAAYIRSLKQ